MSPKACRWRSSWRSSSPLASAGSPARLGKRGTRAGAREGGTGVGLRRGARADFGRTRESLPRELRRREQALRRSPRSGRARADQVAGSRAGRARRASGDCRDAPARRAAPGPRPSIRLPKERRRKRYGRSELRRTSHIGNLKSGNRQWQTNRGIGNRDRQSIHCRFQFPIVDFSAIPRLPIFRLPMLFQDRRSNLHTHPPFAARVGRLRRHQRLAIGHHERERFAEHRDLRPVPFPSSARSAAGSAPAGTRASDADRFGHPGAPSAAASMLMMLFPPVRSNLPGAAVEHDQASRFSWPELRR